VMVWNRTPERAEALARQLDVRAVRVPRAADLLLNCTSVGLEPPCGSPVRPPRGSGAGAPPAEAPGAGALERSATEHDALNQLGLAFDQVGEYSYVVDLVYRAGPTPLLAAAEAQGVPTLDGLEVLVAQGALSFELWTGRAPPVDVMRAAARGEGGST
jgi:shikimate dehydrogenase